MMAFDGITMIVSLLEPSEERIFELENEREVVEAAGLQYLSLPIKDRSVPNNRHAAIDIVHKMLPILRSGGKVVVYCRQGIGRAALIACATLIYQGYNPEKAIALVSTSRGQPVPETEEQIRWLQQFPTWIVQWCPTERLPERRPSTRPRTGGAAGISIGN
jgi:protein-tyrosine phosphatase